MQPGAALEAILDQTNLKYEFSSPRTVTILPRASAEAVEPEASPEPAGSDVEQADTRPEFPKRFGSIQDTKQFCRTFFGWYNCEHKHSGVAMLTPETVHYGRSEAVLEKRQVALNNAFELNPKRFKGGQDACRRIITGSCLDQQTGNGNCEYLFQMFHPYRSTELTLFHVSVGC